MPKAPLNVKPGILQLKVTLDEVQPLVWRRIVVPAGYTFWDLHVAIQDAMGWTDSHLHAFTVRRPSSRATDRIGIPDRFGIGAAADRLPGWMVPVARYFTAPGAKASYEYDFGDSWTHDIELEEVGPRRTGVRYPRCLAGERACPPEDCGGPPGYERLLQTIADPRDAEHQSMMEWLGGPFDPEAFDPKKVRFHNPKTALAQRIADHG